MLNVGQSGVFGGRPCFVMEAWDAGREKVTGKTGPDGKPVMRKPLRANLIVADGAGHWQRVDDVSQDEVTQPKAAEPKAPSKSK